MVKRIAIAKKSGISISSRKAKGRRCQQWVANQIGRALKIPWGKDKLIASREMGQSGTDVRLIGRALELFPFSVECKWEEKWRPTSYIEQAKSNQLPNTDWLVIMKKKRHDYIVMMDAKAFFRWVDVITSENRKLREP